MTQEAAPANPLEGEVPASPASEQPEVQPAPVSGPEEQAPEGEPAVGETQPAWASITEASAVLEHESIKPLVEESNATASKTSYDKAYTDVQARLQPIYQKTRETLDNISTANEDILTQLRRAVEDKVLDGRALEDLFRHHRPALDTLRGVQVSETVGNVLGDLAQRIGFTISPDVVLNYQDWQAGKSQDKGFLDGFVDDVKRNLGDGSMTLAKAEEMAKKQSKKDLDEYKAANAAAQQAQGTPVGAIAPGSSAGSGKNPAEAWVEAGCPDHGPLKEAYQASLGNEYR